MAGRLDGRIALITGVCSGIGLATVERFIAEGARVVVADVQDEKGRMLEQRFAGSAIYRHCDVTLEADIARSVAAAHETYGVAKAGVIHLSQLAATALYFASDDSVFVTGTYQIVDGGIRVGQRISWDETALLPIHEALAAAAMAEPVTAPTHS